MVWLDSHNVRDLRMPFGGVRASAVGREGGVHSLDFYGERQIIHVALADPHTPRFGTGDGLNMKQVPAHPSGSRSARART